MAKRGNDNEFPISIELKTAGVEVLSIGQCGMWLSREKFLPPSLRSAPDLDEFLLKGTIPEQLQKQLPTKGKGSTKQIKKKAAPKAKQAYIHTTSLATPWASRFAHQSETSLVPSAIRNT